MTGQTEPVDLKALIVEDNPDDVTLILLGLARAGFRVEHLSVDNIPELTTALTTSHWDIVLSDHSLPRCTSADVVHAVYDVLAIDIPVIVVSGAIGEELAVELIKAGAKDYVLKDKLARLPIAIRREISAASARREKAALAAERVLDRENFVSIVAHDLRAPVQRVEAMVQVLRLDYQESLGEDGNDIINRIERSTSRLRQMLNSLMVYARNSRGAVVGKAASLKATIDEVLENFIVDPAAVSFRVAEVEADWVVGDTVLIGHVLHNLISNSLKFRRAGCKTDIEIRTWADADGKVHVSVADNGIGIEPRFATKVFEIFYRLHDDDEYDGTGIGLAICKKIVSDHGGDIWIDAGYSGGTRVEFTLRGIEQDARAAPQERSA